ncbi:hypothetical protein Back11_54650 [Paenibacillus baekrokdamisoli]|uniref:Uncharacterized protein n=1 Tax=Paenibacillus baekrokdamisoli TaxID=1712516 RepID=A0A3G9IYZ0_9BACL|nr:hypothetical protein [Paenibacillus baekrokdamisoli]MBB3071897.1 hypothetical protein [Paenibacillus baekrokdamisoli]BBH24120.1 hypothetical protein Back11_54650 [Paenibacillus baekrokdamisoli]
MKYRLFLTVFMSLAFLLSGNATYAIGTTPDYSVQWLLSEKQLGLSLHYDYSSYRTSMGVFSVPTINKAGNTYLIAHRTNDLTSSAILCLNRDGKVKWRKDFKANELDVKGNYIHTDQEGNLYYLTSQLSGKNRKQIAHSLTSDGVERWTYIIPGNDAGELALRGDGNTIVSTTTKLYVINAKGKVTFTKDLPQTNANNLSFLSADNGKILFYKYLFNKDTYLGSEIYIYGSDNKLLYKVPVTIGFGDMKSKVIRFFDNGDFLNVQSYDNMSKLPAVLKMYDSKGKLKWKKVIYTNIRVDDVFISGRNIYYCSGFHDYSTAMAKSLLRIDADTGEEKSNYTTMQKGMPTFYTGYNQETIIGNESLIKAARRDLSQEKDLSLYELGRGDFKRIDPYSLAVTSDYRESLDAFMLAAYQSEDYQVMSARNGFAYVYFEDLKTKQYLLARIKLAKL